VASQLGDGATTTRPTPTEAVSLTSDTLAVAAGNSDTCAVGGGLGHTPMPAGCDGDGRTDVAV
jgi:hypothetical protein